MIQTLSPLPTPLTDQLSAMDLPVADCEQMEEEVLASVMVGETAVFVGATRWGILRAKRIAVSPIASPD